MKKKAVLLLLACSVAQPLVARKTNRPAEESVPHTQISSTKEKNKSAAGNVPTSRMWDYARSLLKYTQALTEQARGNDKQAKILYEELLKAGAPVHVYSGLLRLYDQSGDNRKIAALAPLLEEQFVEDPDILLIFSRAFGAIGDKEEANRRLIELSQRFPGHQEIALNAVETFLQLREPGNAIRVLDNMLESDARNINKHVFHFLRAQVYMRMLNYTQALAALDTALEYNPHFQRAQILRRLIEEQRGQLTQAIRGQTVVLDMTKNAQETMKKHVLQLITGQRKQLKPDAERKEECFRKALKMLEEGQYFQSLTLINNCLKSAPGNVELRLLKIEILMSMRRVDDAVNTLTKWVLSDPNREVWCEALNMLAHSDVSPETIISAFESIHA